MTYAPRWGGVSHSRTYENPGKTSSINSAFPAGSCDASQNDAGTGADEWHKSGTGNSPSVHCDRLHRAEALCQAIADCEPSDAGYLVEGIAKRMGARLPTSDKLAEARAWAASATPDGLKAVAFAAYEAMQPDTAAAFRAYVQRDGTMRAFGPIFAEAAAEYRAERDRRQGLDRGAA